MTPISETLNELKKICDAVEPLPFKKFPLVFYSNSGKDDEYFMANKYMQFGLDARFAMPKLIAALELAIETIKEGRHQAMITANENYKHLSTERLAEIERMLGGE